MEDRQRRPKGKLWLIRAIAALAAAGFGSAALAQGPSRADDSARPEVQFYDVRQQTLEFHTYNRTISLTAEQRAVMQKALSGLRAPCCADRTAATCCCPCNMAQSWWGLSKYLIAERGYGADQVRAAVAGWIDFINPDGFTGDACYSGGCNRPFHENGCGGMDGSRIRFQ